MAIDLVIPNQRPSKLGKQSNCAALEQFRSPDFWGTYIRLLPCPTPTHQPKSARVGHGPLCNVPIGVDCAPAIADLTLFRYEYEYMAKLLKSDYGRALRLNGTFRLRDDISSINSDGVFEEDVSQIYPLSLELNKENVGSTLADILDLTVQLDENIGTFSYKLYDKRDKFNFEIVNYPDLRGNIAKICGYGVVRSELKRYSMLSSKFSDYYKRKKVLFEKVLNKGYLLQKIEHIYNSTKFKS